jgi:hypothetical protein
MKKETNDVIDLDKIFDDLNRRTSEQFEDILSKIEVINSGLKKEVES